MVMQVYIDDSADSLRREVFVLAGFMATPEEWSKVSADWNALLAIHDMTAFKLSRLGKSEAHIAEEFYRIIEKHDVPQALEVVLNIKIWNKVVASISWPPKAKTMLRLLGNPYYFVSKMILRSLIHVYKDLDFEQPIEVIFDEQVREAKVLTGAWDFFVYTLGERKGIFVETPPSFKSDDGCPPLQAADLLAGWVRKSALETKSMTGRLFPWEAVKPITRMQLWFEEKHLYQAIDEILDKEKYLELLDFLEAKKSK